MRAAQGVLPLHCFRGKAPRERFSFEKDKTRCGGTARLARSKRKNRQRVSNAGCSGEKMSRERKRGNLSLPALFCATAGGRSPLSLLCPVPDGKNGGRFTGRGIARVGKRLRISGKAPGMNHPGRPTLPCGRQGQTVVSLCGASSGMSCVVAASAPTLVGTIARCDCLFRLASSGILGRGRAGRRKALLSFAIFRILGVHAENEGDLLSCQDAAIAGRRRAGRTVCAHNTSFGSENPFLLSERVSDSPKGEIFVPWPPSGSRHGKMPERRRCAERTGKSRAAAHRTAAGGGSCSKRNRIRAISV